jgi:TolB-like protein
MLAVLPFENLGERADEDYFSDGLTDELITQLGALEPRHLGVIARTSAMQYKSSGKSASQVGHELGVDYILEGTVSTGGQPLAGCRQARESRRPNEPVDGEL